MLPRAANNVGSIGYMSGGNTIGGIGNNNGMSTELNVNGGEFKRLDMPFSLGNTSSTINKSMTQSKIKNLIEFNANLIIKYQKNYDSLNEDERKFYLSLIYDNLEKLNEIVNIAFFIEIKFVLISPILL